MLEAHALEIRGKDEEAVRQDYKFAENLKRISEQHFE
jgi:hypothetical protein